MDLIRKVTQEKTNGFFNKKIQMYTMFCLMIDFGENEVDISSQMIEYMSIFVTCYALFKNEYEIECDLSEEQKVVVNMVFLAEKETNPEAIAVQRLFQRFYKQWERYI